MKYAKLCHSLKGLIGAGRSAITGVTRSVCRQDLVQRRQEASDFCHRVVVHHAHSDDSIFGVQTQGLYAAPRVKITVTDADSINGV